MSLRREGSAEAVRRGVAAARHAFDTMLRGVAGLCQSSPSRARATCCQSHRVAVAEKPFRVPVAGSAASVEAFVRQRIHGARLLIRRAPLRRLWRALPPSRRLRQALPPSKRSLRGRATESGRALNPPSRVGTTKSPMTTAFDGLNPPPKADGQVTQKRSLKRRAQP